MKLILIDGGPASGKNTLGERLVVNFNLKGEKSILLDHDIYVEQLCPTWIWANNDQKESDLLTAQTNFIQDINKYLYEGYIVIAIGVRFLTLEDVTTYTNRMSVKCPIYLYHLNVPLPLRKQRLAQRGPHSLIDLDKDQQDRDKIKVWPGYIYHNVNSPQQDTLRLLRLIEDNVGVL